MHLRRVLTRSTPLPSMTHGPQKVVNSAPQDTSQAWAKTCAEQNSRDRDGHQQFNQRESIANPELQTGIHCCNPTSDVFKWHRARGPRMVSSRVRTYCDSNHRVQVASRLKDLGNRLKRQNPTDQLHSKSLIRPLPFDH